MAIRRLIFVGLLMILLLAGIQSSVAMKTETYNFGFPFNQSYRDIFSFKDVGMISNNALQLTPDSAGNFSLKDYSGRILFNKTFTLWEEKRNKDERSVASFNTTFIINIFPVENTTNTRAGMAFLIVPDLSTQADSDGEFLGLTNMGTDGSSTNHLFAIAFDTTCNCIRIDINNIRSNRSVSLSPLNITLASIHTVFHKVWIHYDGGNKSVAVYLAELSEQMETVQIPKSPLLTMDDLDLSLIVEKESYFGFSGSTSETPEINCVLSWNITVEVIDLPNRWGKFWKVITAAVAVAAGTFVAAIGWFWRRRRNANPPGEPNILSALRLLPGTPREFDFKVLKKATGNFDDKNKLGEGGYGVVYRGVLPNITGDDSSLVEVAVKKFTREDTIKSKLDFLSELTIINRLRHKHLVKLLGWCHKNRMLLLVYEYMPNGSLDKHIFCQENQVPVSWNFRYNILKGVAFSLQYLHHEYEHTVIHRDLKASNILLDVNFNARLGDFGLARALEQEKTSYAEMEGVHGTMGYIAPECFHTGKATRESDVFAFGAVLLEVACGHRPWAKLGRFNNLCDWVWSHHRERQILQALDSRLDNDYVVEEAERVLLLGLACLHPIGTERPNAHVIVQILSELMPVPVVPPFKPAFTWPASMASDTSIDMDSTADITLVSHTEERMDGYIHKSTV